MGVWRFPGSVLRLGCDAELMVELGSVRRQLKDIGLGSATKRALLELFDCPDMQMVPVLALGTFIEILFERCRILCSFIGQLFLAMGRAFEKKLEQEYQAALGAKPRDIPPTNVKIVGAHQWGRNGLEKSLMMYVGAASFDVRDAPVLGCCVYASTVAGRSTLVMLLTRPDNTAIVPPPQDRSGLPR